MFDSLNDSLTFLNIEQDIDEIVSRPDYPQNLDTSPQPLKSCISKQKTSSSPKSIPTKQVRFEERIVRVTYHVGLPSSDNAQNVVRIERLEKNVQQPYKKSFIYDGSDILSKLGI